MPTNKFDTSDGGAGQGILDFFGAPPSAPPPPTAAPRLGQAPTVSATPVPGQGVATDSAGHLPVSAAAQAFVVLIADPANPAIGQCWYRSDTKQLSIRHNATTTVRVTLA